MTDSIPTANDHVETLLLCSPAQMLNTAVATETLNKVDQIDRAREEEAHGLYISISSTFHANAF